MKQALSKVDLETLSIPENKYLTERREKYCYPKRLNIGHLIHFLIDHGDPVQLQLNSLDGPDSPADVLLTSVTAKLRQLVQSHPVPMSSDSLSKWDEWVTWLETIEADFTQVLLRRQMWRVMLQVFEEAPEESPLRLYGRPYMDWLAGMYAPIQSIAVRRHADTRKDVVSLKRILRDMQVNHNVLETHSSCPATNEELQSEIDRLDELAETVIHYTNKQVAHLDPKGLERIPTFGDLDKSLDQLFEILRQSALMIKGSSLEMEIVEATAWEEILHHPWIIDPNRSGETCVRQ